MCAPSVWGQEVFCQATSALARSVTIDAADSVTVFLSTPWLKSNSPTPESICLACKRRGLWLCVDHTQSEGMFAED